MKPQLIDFIEAKGSNRRIHIYLQDINGNKSFLVITKRLLDKKTRHIATTESIYSVETFVFMQQLFTHFLDNAKIKNKILLKELSKMERIQAKTSLT